MILTALWIAAFIFLCGASESNDEALVMSAVAVFMASSAAFLADINAREKREEDK